MFKRPPIKSQCKPMHVHFSGFCVKKSCVQLTLRRFLSQVLDFLYKTHDYWRRVKVKLVEPWPNRCNICNFFPILITFRHSGKDDRQKTPDWEASDVWSSKSLQYVLLLQLDHPYGILIWLLCWSNCLDYVCLFLAYVFSILEVCWWNNSSIFKNLTCN